MDWIHCNDCFKQPHLNPDTVFVLTSCARIQCTSCNSTNSCVRRDCPQCRAQNYSCVTLDENMPTPVEDFFRIPVDHLKKYIKVHDFQRGHRDRLIKYLIETRKQACTVSNQWQTRYSELESKMETTLASERNLRAENSGLKEQNQSLQMQLKQYIDRDSNNRRTDSRTSLTSYGAHRSTQTSSASQSTMAPVNNSRPIVQPPPPARKPVQHHPVYQTNTGKKVFAPSTQSSVGPTRNRVSSSSASQQPYPSSRNSNQFLNVETPSYVSSSRPNPQASSRNINPLPTPIQQRPTTMTSAIRSAERRSGGSDLSQGGSYVNPRVHAFFSQRAQEALTPDIIRK